MYFDLRNIDIYDCTVRNNKENICAKVIYTKDLDDLCCKNMFVFNNLCNFFKKHFRVFLFGNDGRAVLVSKNSLWSNLKQTIINDNDNKKPSFKFLGLTKLENEIEPGSECIPNYWAKTDLNDYIYHSMDITDCFMALYGGLSLLNSYFDSYSARVLQRNKFNEALVYKIASTYGNLNQILCMMYIKCTERDDIRKCNEIKRSLEALMKSMLF